MPSKKNLTTEQLTIDRELNRINRQIREAFKQFGSESKLAKQYETLLYGRNARTGRETDRNAPAAQYHDMIRYTKEGIPQLSRSQTNISRIQSGAVANAILQLGRVQTVAAAKQAMIKAYEKRTGTKVKGRAAAAAIKEEVKRYYELENGLSRALTEMYKIERQRGIQFQNHDEIRKLSKGRWTSEKELSEMLRLAQEAVQDENAAVIDEFDALQGY